MAVSVVLKFQTGGWSVHYQQHQSAHLLTDLHTVELHLELLTNRQKVHFEYSYRFGIEMYSLNHLI